jgi:hypothetical protein
VHDALDGVLALPLLGAAWRARCPDRLIRSEFYTCQHAVCYSCARLLFDGDELKSTPCSHQPPAKRTGCKW